MHIGRHSGGDFQPKLLSYAIFPFPWVSPFSAGGRFCPPQEIYLILVRHFFILGVDFLPIQLSDALFSFLWVPPNFSCGVTVPNHRLLLIWPVHAIGHFPFGAISGPLLDLISTAGLSAPISVRPRPRLSLGAHSWLETSQSIHLARVHGDIPLERPFSHLHSLPILPWRVA